MANRAQDDDSDRVSIPLDPITALRAFLRVNPNDPPAEPEHQEQGDEDEPHGD